MPKHIVILTTVPDKKTGQKIAKRLVEERLAACVTICGACQSHYWWQRQVTRSQEYLLTIKTKASLYSELEKLIKKFHPYEIPEIVALPIFKGLRKYLDWIDKETKN